MNRDTASYKNRAGSLTWIGTFANGASGWGVRFADGCSPVAGDLATVSKRDGSISTVKLTQSDSRGVWEFENVSPLMSIEPGGAWDALLTEIEQAGKLSAQTYNWLSSVHVKLVSIESELRTLPPRNGSLKEWRKLREKFGREIARRPEVA